MSDNESTVKACQIFELLGIAAIVAGSLKEKREKRKEKRE